MKKICVAEYLLSEEQADDSIEIEEGDYLITKAGIVKVKYINGDLVVCTDADIDYETAHIIDVRTSSGNVYRRQPKEVHDNERHDYYGNIQLDKLDISDTITSIKTMEKKLKEGE